MTRAPLAFRSRLLFLLTCAPLWGGCAALGTLDTADTLPRGKTRLNVQGWVQGVNDHQKPDVVPQVAVSWRGWLADGVDIGGRASPQGADGSLKVQLVGRDERAPFVMSVAPTLGVVLFSHAWLPSASATKTQFYAALPLLLAARNPEDGSQLVLGLRPTWMRFHELGYPATRDMLAMGGSLGYAFRVGRDLRVMPEVAVLLPVMEKEEARPWSRVNVQPQLQFGVAYLMDFGG